MIKSLTVLIALAFCLISIAFAQVEPFDAKASLVEIEVTKKAYDYKVPWVIRNAQTRKNGIVIGRNRILTTADGLSGQYLCRIRKGGESKQYVATLKWVDYYTNLAVFDVEEPLFWEGKGMQAVPLATDVPQRGNVTVYRWRSGRIESRAAEIVRLFIGKSKLSYVQHLKLLVSSEIDAAGWAEVVIYEGKIIGLTSASSNKNLTILPAPFIASVLERRALEADPGVGCFDFFWMSAKNPALSQSKGLHREDCGVVVTEVGARGLADNTLHVGDILLEIDGFAIDSEGNYIDPEYGRLVLNGLATRDHVPGDDVPMTIWREGRQQKVSYRLPRADFEKEIIPDQRYDLAPEYLIAGGLVFQPFDGPLHDSFAGNSPILLDAYASNPPTEERAGLVLLTMVMPDEFTRGYESARYLMVDQINEQTIHTLDDVLAALGAPDNGYHVIRFMQEDSLQYMVLDAEAMSSATQRVLQHYSIPEFRSHAQ